MNKNDPYKFLNLYAQFSREMEYYFWDVDDVGNDLNHDLRWLKPDKREDFIATIEKSYESAYGELKELFRSVDEHLEATNLANNFIYKMAAPKNINMTRDLYWNIWRKRSKKARLNCQIGFHFHDVKGQYNVDAWIYVRGGLSKEIGLKDIVGKNCRLSSDTGFKSGTIVLGASPRKVSTIIEAPNKSASLLVKPFIGIGSKAWGHILDLANPRRA